ncbi:MAG: hypothetical protein U9R75_08645 [Candidatus Thermoplasmatota archaeon]|nr:hypothetical protein [Candidatus Thermoplasmatota archaeon]
MTVKRTELLNVEAKRVGVMGKKMNIRIDVNSNISQIYLIEEDEARVDFRFMATYTGLGTVGMEGRITFTNGAKELYEKWTETGNMPDDPAQEIHGAIMKSCMPVAVILSREVNLPPPMPMPPIKMKGKKKASTPSSGMEVA